MISNDNQQYITVEILRSELGGLRAEIHSDMKEIRSETQTVRDIALVNSAKIDAYRDFTGIWFTVLTVVIGLIGFIGTIAPLLREIYRDAKKHKPQETLTEEKVQSMINNSIAQTLGKLER